MEIIVSSSDNARFSNLSRAADRITAKNQLRQISLHTERPETIDELIGIVGKIEKKSEGCIIIFDTFNREKWISDVRRLKTELRSAVVFLVSETPYDAVKVINHKLNVSAFIDTSSEDFEEITESSIIGFENSRGISYGGIAALGECKETKYIPFDDIYFIEAVKYSHLRCIHYTNGSAYVRKSISELYKAADTRFERTRNNVIANLSMVKSFSGNELFFGNGLHCGISRNNVPKVKKRIAEVQKLTQITK